MLSLDTRESIANAANERARHLDRSYKDVRSREWTVHIVEVLDSFCLSTLELTKPNLFHRRFGAEGNTEFLWDYLAATEDKGAILVAESEQNSSGAAGVKGLKHDFGKLLYVYAPLRLLVAKVDRYTPIEKLKSDLETYAQTCSQNLNPGSAFILHFCHWDEKGSETYLWPRQGDPQPIPPEPLDFRRVPRETPSTT